MLEKLTDRELQEKIYITRESSQEELAEALEEILRLRSIAGTEAVQRVKAGMKCQKKHQDMQEELAELRNLMLHKAGSPYVSCHFPSAPCGHAAEEDK